MWILSTVLLVAVFVPWQYYFISWFVVPFCVALYENSTDAFLYSIYVRRILRRVLLPLADFKIFGNYQTTPHIYAVHPHGLLSLGLFFGFMLSEQPCIALVSEELMAIPVVAELLLLVGARPACQEILEKALQRKQSVALVPGGVVEMGMAQQDTIEKISIKRRENFLNNAKKLERPVIPCLMLGENRAYRIWKHPRLQQLQQWCYSILGWWGPIIAGGRYNTILPAASIELYILEPVHDFNNYYDRLSEEAKSHNVVLNFG